MCPEAARSRDQGQAGRRGAGSSATPGNPTLTPATEGALRQTRSNGTADRPGPVMRGVLVGLGFPAYYTLTK